jgi:hypothetical protein
VSGDEDYLSKTQDVKQSNLFKATQGNIIICHAQHSIVQHYTIQCSTVQYQAVIYQVNFLLCPTPNPSLTLALSPARVVSCLSGREGRTELALFL